MLLLLYAGAQLSNGGPVAALPEGDDQPARWHDHHEESPTQWVFLACILGSSAFPRSLCFMWFWFGLEILRLVYKNAFFKILIGFYLIWAFNFQNNSTVSTKSWKKNFFKIWRAGYQKKQNFALISKMCRTLASKSSQRFFLRKIQFFCKIFFPFCQTRDFCTFLKSAQNSASFDTLHAQFRRNFFQLL